MLLKMSTSKALLIFSVDVLFARILTISIPRLSKLNREMQALKEETLGFLWAQSIDDC
ncbi:MAG: hypothetical protein Ct9H90mP18_05810 [Gammaproteobacteria bacterium]|nr:MAG: hypothetical protein Ct9H90mP18_05810 [Gammaproteobacteria bacterium]